jgi:ribosomal protein S18 acetylase RimI-like enzyme
VSLADARVVFLDETHAGAFRELRLFALRDSPDAFGSTYESEAARPLADFAQRLREAAVFAAFIGDEMVGMAGLARQTGPKERHKATLWGVYVKPHARGMGLARRLIEAALATAATQVEQVHLTVAAQNRAASALYEKLGFVRYGLEPRGQRTPDGRYLDEALMVCLFERMTVG